MNAQVQPITNPASYYLPLDSVDAANSITAKLTAVTDLMQSADCEEFASDTLANTAWLIRDMLRDLHDITNSRG